MYSTKPIQRPPRPAIFPIVEKKLAIVHSSEVLACGHRLRVIIGLYRTEEAPADCGLRIILNWPCHSRFATDYQSLFTLPEHGRPVYRDNHITIY
jgi:hypothetical protein